MDSLNMSTRKPFESPYKDFAPSEIAHTSINFPAKPKAFLNSITGKHGSFQTTVHILLSKLIDQLHEHGITSYDPERYERAVAECHLKLGRTIADSPAGQQAPNRDVGRGTASVARGPETALGKPAHVGGVSGEKTGRKKGGVKG